MSTVANSRYLDLRALSAIEQMRVTSRRRIDGTYSGRHTSRQQGGAGEFVDYREYSGGEDLRRLDWKVFARTGKAFVRLHREETNLLCTLALDVSRSMLFGARNGKDHEGSKLEYTQYLATALSHIIGLGQDQVGLAVLQRNLQEYVPPGGTPSHILHIQRIIEQLRAVKTATMAEGLRELFLHSGRMGMLLLMSDFLIDDLDETFNAIRLFRHRNWEVILLHLVHPFEERLPEGPAFRFEGLEDGQRIRCSPAEVRTLYQQRFAAHLTMVRQLALAEGCDYRRVSTAVSYLKTLDGFLVGRTG